VDTREPTDDVEMTEIKSSSSNAGFTMAAAAAAAEDETAGVKIV